MKTFALDYMMVATLADTRVDDERQAQYYRELRREAEMQERNRQAWNARWKAVRSLFASTAKPTVQTGNAGPIAAAS
ncbi:hypothetical protein EOI86_18090 [Hwanghaeella grinnelliae]|uniref:Uncharacterized protein n=1 Tax=Hwanghaeella grinnelliae TaxID=2500179 RepID=A0A437QJS7_9PROT|nr:hypothetical protein [Hwanghaeella grinnelliae]RVU34759.1 hypothetical protein EOI86_18090 [Hwanghaeella grinnelliae]